MVFPQTPSIFITLRHDITNINDHQQTRQIELDAEKQSHEATQAELDNLKSKHTSMLTALALEKNHRAKTKLRLSNLRADHEAAKQSYHSSARKLRDFSKLKHAAYISEREGHQETKQKLLAQEIEYAVLNRTYRAHRKANGSFYNIKAAYGAVKEECEAVMAELTVVQQELGDCREVNAILCKEF